jgi:tetratricopeptide (TPR) repeat protein
MNVISFAYTKQGNYSMAEKWARTLLNSKLYNSTAYFRLAYLAHEQNRFKEAVRYYEKCLEINSKDESVLGNLGNVYYYNLDNKDYGIYLWKKAAKLGNKHAQHQLGKNGIEW